jgi:hypothetical protein
MMQGSLARHWKYIRSRHYYSVCDLISDVLNIVKYLNPPDMGKNCRYSLVRLLEALGLKLISPCRQAPRRGSSNEQNRVLEWNNAELIKINPLRSEPRLERSYLR